MCQITLIGYIWGMQINPDFGKIIMLNGASSPGKSTLCEALQKELTEPFLRFSLDFLCLFQIYYLKDQNLKRRRVSKTQMSTGIKLIMKYRNS
jgi:chloramphenicol 3-O-phosphotransferase